MARHRYIKTSVLCFLVFAIALIFRRSFDAGDRLYQNLSSKTYRCTIIPVDETRVSIPFNGHDQIPQVNAGMHSRVDTTADSAKFTKAVDSGNALLCMMKMTKEAAAAWAVLSALLDANHMILQPHLQPWAATTIDLVNCSKPTPNCAHSSPENQTPT